MLGTIAVVMLCGAAILWFVAGSQNIWTGACLKVGMVVAALWLALPTITRRNDWGQTSWGAVVGFSALALVLMGKRVDIRIVLPMLFGVAVTMMILSPKSKSGRKQ